MATTQVIAAIQEKGGAGKSTLLCAMAAYMAADGARPVIIDTDPQKTCTKWEELSDCGVDVLEHENDDTVHDVIAEMRETYDVVFVDTAGFKSSMASYVITYADLIFIPAKASMPDVQGALRTRNHVKNATRMLPVKPDAYFVLSDVDKTTNITGKIRASLESHGLPTISTPLFHRTGFKEMHSTGGMPQGAALGNLREFMGDLQTAGLLQWYGETSRKEAAHG